jgi:hypothetical protein
MRDFKAIEELDLDPIKVKLMHEASGEGWSLERAEAVEKEYRRFLLLMKKYPEEQAAPLMDVDIFWHYHILDTMKYAADCETVFGYFLHHFPYIGLRGEDDLAAHHRLGERMKELYEETFGEDYLRVEAGSHASGQTAWSARAADMAWSASPAKAGVAWSASPAKAGVAWSASPAKAGVAWSASPAKAGVAWSASPAKAGVAWSASPAKAGVAWSASPAKAGVAWSASPAKADMAWSASPVKADGVPGVAPDAPKGADPLFTVRPRLPQSAT